MVARVKVILLGSFQHSKFHVKDKVEVRILRTAPIEKIKCAFGEIGDHPSLRNLSSRFESWRARQKVKMEKTIRVVTQTTEKAWFTLTEAMDYAKTVNEFVTIQGPDFEVVGMFGVDEVANGMTPDGVEYTWKKRRR